MKDKAVSDVVGTIILVSIVVIFMSLIASYLYIDRPEEEVYASISFNDEDLTDNEVKATIENTYNSDFIYVKSGSITNGVVLNKSGKTAIVSDVDGDGSIVFIGRTDLGTEQAIKTYNFR